MITFAATMLALAQAGPGPLDAFKANFMLVQCYVKYRYTRGEADASALGRLRRRERVEFTMRQDPFLLPEIVGEWGCDGSAEYFLYSSPDEIIRAEVAKPLGAILFYMPQREVIYDGSTLAMHEIDPYHHLPRSSVDYIEVRFNDSYEACGFLFCAGPFCWGIPFPHMLEFHFPGPGATTTRRSSTRDGYPVEVEIYEKPLDRSPDTLLRTEVAYDPAIGYLPRHQRDITTNREGTWVTEFYLIDARPCAAGGFVPTEWYMAYFTVNDFAGRYPSYNDETELEPADQVNVIHFKVTEFNKDWHGPVALTKLDELAKSGYLKKHYPHKPNAQSLTLEDIRRGANQNRNRRQPDPALPNLGPTIDRAEAEELAGLQAGPRWPPWVCYVPITVVFLLLGAFTISRWRQLKALGPLLLAAMLGAQGCAKTHPGAAPRPRQASHQEPLAAEFSEKYSFYEVEASSIATTLLVRNVGDRPVRLTHADGGCTCRRIDQSKLPATLPPRGTLALRVELPAKVSLPNQLVTLTLDTDIGPLKVSAPFCSFPTHQFSPNSIEATLAEGQSSWSFDLVHRAIFRADRPAPETVLKVPRGFVAEKGATVTGRIAFAPEFRYADTAYHVILQDRRIGINKDIITLHGPGDQKLIEVPVLWQRMPFLSSSPTRVVLGSRPVRVLLQCPDEGVKFTRVISVPPGVKAVITSGRELTLELAHDAPGVINGAIEVGTTASDRPPLRIPTVRYAPVAQGSPGT